MTRKDRIDATGAAFLIGISALLGLNQVLMKLINAGMSPVFQAGMRSACAFLPVLLFAWIMRRPLTLKDGSLPAGIIAGVIFALEFILLFQAVEFTSVARVSVLFYTMPVIVALAAHWLIPGERLTPLRVMGLVMAVLGVGVALLSRDPATGSLRGDMMALGAAACWAAIALLARTTKLSRACPEMQLLYQLAVSAPIMLVLAPLFGPLIREMTGTIAALFAFQVLVVVAFGFVTWFWVLSIYPASDMASFSFLAPVFGVIFAWAILNEPITADILIALALVGTGIYCVNRRRKARPKPVSLS
ncbi:drug/metabolite transporter (DMT)-like permease [Rubricella aquisinus]|uniref:Drug/metabolite transporter (DMT)-like permease n=1 Tax=Rubricella aquisinus TaxID=2028108 RepID=A0A840WTB0_9RHOB|nr:DMT family transporter [Rubricella aquisinus]MBB5516912.1 drug/metabolite transporter (DMT)-like permease [Rubricella aquisinus]